MLPTLFQRLETLRQTQPLVLNLCNLVTMEFVANSQLALGTAPIMSNDQRELDELMALSKALYINIGTLDQNFIDMAIYAAESAQQRHIPMILDPVGAGASRLRTDTARMLAPMASIIRGNASEIIALTGDGIHTKGVESVHSSKAAKPHALHLAKQFKNCILVSGAVDYLCDAHRQASIPFGAPIMGRITGMGCGLTGIVAAFHTILPDAFEAAQSAALYVGLCGSLAASKTPQPAAFKAQFLDCLYEADFNALAIIYA